jgi:hypothetical protein
MNHSKSVKLAVLKKRPATLPNITSLLIFSRAIKAISPTRPLDLNSIGNLGPEYCSLNPYWNPWIRSLANSGFGFCTFVKTASSFYINVRSAMVTILPQCAKYNLNLLHILKLTDFLQNVLLKKKNICLQGCHCTLRQDGYHCTSDIYVKTTCSFYKSTN